MDPENLDINILGEEKAVQEAGNWLEQKTFNEITEEVYQRGSFTVVVIHASANNKLFEGVGFAKARPEITLAQYDSERGKIVARGRAIHDLFGEYKRDSKKIKSNNESKVTTTYVSDKKQI